MKNSTITISGMGCSGCADSVEAALNSLDGVVSASVNLEKGTAEISYAEAGIKPSDFEKAIEEAGYTMTGVKS